MSLSQFFTPAVGDGPMSPLERRAAFRAAATLREITMADAARALGVSYNHLVLVLNGQRIGSARLRRAAARFVEVPVERFFGSVKVRPTGRKKVP